MGRTVKTGNGPTFAEVRQFKADLASYELMLKREKENALKAGAESTIALFRATARRFSVAQTRVADLAEIASSALKRIQEADHSIADAIAKDAVRGSTVTYLAGGHTQVALVLTKLGAAKNHYDFVYGDLCKDFNAAVRATSEKEMRKVLLEEFDGSPPPIGKAEFEMGVSKSDFRVAT